MNTGLIRKMLDGGAQLALDPLYGPGRVARVLAGGDWWIERRFREMWKAVRYDEARHIAAGLIAEQKRYAKLPLKEGGWKYDEPRRIGLSQVRVAARRAAKQQGRKAA